MTEAKIMLFGGIYAMILAFTICGWTWYQEAVGFETRYKQLKLGWVEKTRWVWTALVILVSMIGLFTILMAGSGMYFQPKPIIARPIDWPDSQEINHLSGDWSHPDTLIAYQDDTVHIRFMHRYNLPPGTLLHPGPDTLVKQ